MLKGHVFKKQIFGNQIFALFINTFLNGHNGISNDYKNSMKITYNGAMLTVNSGVACVQGRFIEEDTSSNISAGTDTAFCRLVIEINLDKENTVNDFTQAQYKIIKGSTSYPNLTQTEIVKNNSGIYQYELAQFKTSANGISEFIDKRTFLDFDSIYTKIQEEYRTILEELKNELASVEDGSAYMLNTIETKSFTANGINGTITRQGKVAVINFQINGKALSMTDIKIASETLRPSNSCSQSFIGIVGTSMSSALGPVSMHISDSGNGIDMSITKTPGLNEEYQTINGTMTYICA